MQNFILVFGFIITFLLVYKFSDGVPAPLRKIRNYYKGLVRNLACRPGDWVVLDVETTGLSENSELIEVGLIDGNGQELMRQRVLPVGRISAASASVHGIKRKDLKGCPTWDEIEDQFMALIKDKRIVAYNADFDIRILKQAMKKYHSRAVMDNDISCMMLAYAAYAGEVNKRFGDFRWHKLKAAARAFGLKPPNHSAVRDAQTTRDLVYALAKVRW